MQHLIVAIIVVFATLSVLRRYLPAGARRAVVGSLSAGMARIGLPGVSARMMRWTVAGSSCSDGCNTCGGCGSAENATADGHAADDSATQSVISVEALRRTAHKAR